MTKKQFAIHFAIRYVLLVLLVAVVGYFFDASGSVSFIVSIGAFAWSVHAYCRHNGIPDDTRVRHYLVGIGSAICMLLALPLLCVLVWSGEFPLWLMLITLIVGLLLNAVALYVGFSLAKSLHLAQLRKQHQQAEGG